MNKKISIIIPVYNVEQYVLKCLDSILSQCEPYSDLVEVIVVDDGSTDSSGSICQNNVKNHEYANYYKKDNGGLSSARNYGMSKANSEYVWFIDSDDYIEKGAIEKILLYLNKYSPDVLVIQSKTIDENGMIEDECKYTIEPKLYEIEEYLIKLKQNPNSSLFCAQYFICKKEVIDKNKLSFKEGIIHEDELWTPKLLLKTKTVLYSGFNIYYHFMRLGSIMHGSKIKERGRCHIIVANNLFMIFDQQKRFNLDYLYDRAVVVYLQAAWETPLKIDKSFKKRLYLLKKSKLTKTKLKSFLYLLSPKLYIAIHKKTRE